MKTEAQDQNNRIDLQSFNKYTASEIVNKKEKFTQEFSNNLTIENENKDDDIGINNSPKKVKLANFDPEKTQF